MKNEPRVAIVFDGTGWFVRRVRLIEHDLDRDEKVYRCDESIGGKCRSVTEAVDLYANWRRDRIERIKKVLTTRNSSSGKS